MLKARFYPYTLRFAFVAHTSRETFRSKQTYFVEVYDTERPEIVGRGEAAVFPSLQPSFVDFEHFEAELADVCANINDYAAGRTLPRNSAIRFGIEAALGDLRNGGVGHPFGDEALNNIADGIPINGLVWMNDAETMARQISEKLEEGFRCLKLKIGAIDFDKELDLVRRVRRVFAPDKLTIRLDANGAFTADNALARLEALAPYSIHSVEQPVSRDSAAMAEICRLSPIDIALDEDIIERWWTDEKRADWLAHIAPRYIIIKPSLCGGFEAADCWVATAESLGIGWWATSALESNVGLTAIAQWLGTHCSALDRYHGLGTGQIYTNNIEAGIARRGERIFAQ